MTRSLWGEEIIPPPPLKKIREKQAQPIRMPAYWGDSNDINGWFLTSGPETLNECDDLRKAMAKTATIGRFGADTYITRTGRKLLRVKGPCSNVMIVSRKARALFNKKLRNREIHLEVLRDQFKGEN